MKQNTLQIQIKKIASTATLPTQAYQEAAGIDLYANESRRVPGNGKAVIKTGLALAIPNGYYGHIKPRSGIATTTPLLIDAGVIDSDYRGEIGIVVSNISEMPFDVDSGMKLAQMTFEKKYTVEFKEVTDLPESERNTRGFGSSD